MASKSTSEGPRVRQTNDRTSTNLLLVVLVVVAASWNKAKELMSQASNRERESKDKNQIQRLYIILRRQDESLYQIQRQCECIFGTLWIVSFLGKRKAE